MTSTARACWVIPCYNEAARLPGEELVSFLDAAPDIDLLLVNDGSTDGTEALLSDLAGRRPARISLLCLEKNEGKAEAVRRGLVEALQKGAEFVGYLDADLATPLAEMRRLTEIIRGHDFDMILGSRVLLLGRRIERRFWRHYLGRVFATVASLVLELPVYDTQCGAKVLRRTAPLDRALQTPFLSQWAFDVELIARLLAAPDGLEPRNIVEEPLREWRDIPGSKLHLRHIVESVADLGRIGWQIRRGSTTRAHR